MSHVGGSHSKKRGEWGFHYAMYTYCNLSIDPGSTGDPVPGAHPQEHICLDYVSAQNSCAVNCYRPVDASHAG